jgi:hypothetical protein
MPFVIDKICYSFVFVTNLCIFCLIKIFLRHTEKNSQHANLFFRLVWETQLSILKNREKHNNNAGFTGFDKLRLVKLCSGSSGANFVNAAGYKIFNKGIFCN